MSAVFVEGNQIRKGLLAEAIKDNVATDLILFLAKALVPLEGRVYLDDLSLRDPAQIDIEQRDNEPGLVHVTTGQNIYGYYVTPEQLSPLWEQVVDVLPDRLKALDVNSARTLV